MRLAQSYQLGELDERITFEEQTFTENDAGGQTGEWVQRGSVWAHVRPQRGNERQHSDRLAAEGGYLVVIRNEGIARDVNEAWRIKWRGRAMNIVFVQDAGPRDLYLPMEVERGVAT